MARRRMMYDKTTFRVNSDTINADVLFNNVVVGKVNTDIVIYKAQSSYSVTISGGTLPITTVDYTLDGYNLNQGGNFQMFYDNTLMSFYRNGFGDYTHISYNEKKTHTTYSANTGSVTITKSSPNITINSLTTQDVVYTTLYNVVNATTSSEVTVYTVNDYIVITEVYFFTEYGTRSLAEYELVSPNHAWRYTMNINQTDVQP